MTLEQIRPEPMVINRKCGQRLSEKGRILINKKGWCVRLATIFSVSFIIIYNVKTGLSLDEPLIIYASLLPIHSILIVAIGWFFYKNPAKGHDDNSLVSIIVPVYNQKSMITIVIDAIFQSTHKNIEVVVVNDGSTDGTKEILNELAKKYANLKLIHKVNEGKRKSVAAGFYACSGKYVVLVDSDSVIDRNSITEFVKTFNGDNKIGAVVAHAKVWNAEKNFLTKCQDGWYDFFFNIRKTTESTLGAVLCCSGCMAGYRHEAIAGFIPYWVQMNTVYGDDRELTSYALATTWAKKELCQVYGKMSSISKKTMEYMAKYDDAEDRGLTAQSLLSWKSAYVASAIVYTDVPDKWSVFINQQKRWKRGTARVSFFVSTFFWRKHPLMSLLFYLDFMMMYATPLIIFAVFVYEPLISHNVIIPLTYLAGMVLTAIAHGLDYRFRDPTAKNWKFKPLIDFITTYLTSWLIFPALWGFRKNEWLTR